MHNRIPKDIYIDTSEYLETQGNIRGASRSGTSALTHWPTEDFHPMMLDCTQAWDLTFAPPRTVDLDRHTPATQGQLYSWLINTSQLVSPSSITTSGPTTTLGPIRHPCPSLADGCWDRGRGEEGEGIERWGSHQEPQCQGPMLVAMTTILPPTRPRVCSRAYTTIREGGSGRIFLIGHLTITFVT